MSGTTGGSARTIEKPVEEGSSPKMDAALSVVLSYSLFLFTIYCVWWR